MSATLYLLRQQPDRISPSLFRESDADMDIVFVEHATLTTRSSVKGATVSSEGVMVSDSHQILRYDDLVDKIFSSERIIVI
jgi:hypothetical protein